MPNHANSDHAQDDTQEQSVKQGFWPKLRKAFGKVPFAQEATAGYYAAFDKETPRLAKATLLGALAYFIMPVDLIPDFVAGLGYTDDASVLALAFATVKGSITPKHREKAAVALGRTPVGDPEDEAKNPQKSSVSDGKVDSNAASS